MGKSSGKSSGFSLLELMVAVAILLVVAGGAFTFLMSYQNTYLATALRSDMHSTLRGATDLMQQDISQAGTVSLSATCSGGQPTTVVSTTTSTAGCPTLKSAVSAGLQTATVNTNTGAMYVGEALVVDVGSSQETVTTTAVTSTTFTASFANSHTAGAVVTAPGVFPQGILFANPGCTGTCTGATPASSSGTDLYLFGDIHGDGTLAVVHYNCNQPSTPVTTTWVTPGTLTRADSALTANPESTPVVLLDNIAANPNNIPCFQYTWQTATIGATTYTFATSVSVTLTVQGTEIDPVRKTVPVTETKSFMNLAPRNILGAYSMGTLSISSYFQTGPSGNCQLQLSCKCTGTGC